MPNEEKNKKDQQVDQQEIDRASNEITESSSAIWILNQLAKLDKLSSEMQDRIASSLGIEDKEKVFYLMSLESQNEKLTPFYLGTKISPYLIAISEIQRIFDQILKRDANRVLIRSITQFSPISVSLDGAAEAVQAVQETVIPWRRKHAETMARLAELEKQAEIESKKAEILEKRASAAKNRAEAEKMLSESAKQHEEANNLKMQNAKLNIELHRAKIQLALDILNHLAPNLSEMERIDYLVKLLSPLDIIGLGDLEIVASVKDAG